MHLRPEFARTLERGEVLSPIEVLQSNMEFWHREAEQVLATIKKLPKLPRDRQTDAQVQGLRLLADHMTLRDKAADTAVVLARYLHRPLAPKPYREGEEETKPKPLARVELLTVSPQADEAFRRAAAGLPPEPRKVL